MASLNGVYEARVVPDSDMTMPRCPKNTGASVGCSSGGRCRGQAVRETVRCVCHPLRLRLLGPLVLLGGVSSEDGGERVELGGSLVDLRLLHGAGGGLPTGERGWGGDRRDRSKGDSGDERYRCGAKPIHGLSF